MTELVAEIEDTKTEYEQEITETEIQEVISTPSVLRTISDGCFEVYDGVWGSYIRPCFDPEANVEITENHLQQFQIKKDIHRIPADLWARWVNLCFYFVEKVPATVEVSVRILRSNEDPSKYRIVVPKQKVSAVTVRAYDFNQCIDIETGEEFTQYPPEGWIPCGSSHSHNTMGAFFSSEDDKYELNDPGIHLVVGSIDTNKRTYTIAASVVGSGRRFELEYTHLVDALRVEGVTFHESVKDYVECNSSLATTHKPLLSTTQSTYQKWSKDATSKDTDDLSAWGWTEGDVQEYDNMNWNDPHYWNDGISEFRSSGTTEFKLWQLIDSLNDYATAHLEDVNRLHNLKDELSAFMDQLDLILGCQV
jgi:hypothetical protein